MNAVEFESYALSFGGNRILRGVTAAFPARSISVIAGRSGAGKSVLLRSINRLNEELAGCRAEGSLRVSLGGELRENRAIALPFLRSRCAMLFQTPALFDISIYENLALPLRRVLRLNGKEAAARIHAALEQVGLTDETARRLRSGAKELSGGQQQRLCLARLIAFQPEVFLLDEPTASLDTHSARLIEDALRGLSQTATVIMVSHSPGQALRLADKLFICAEGTLRASEAAGPEELAAALIQGDMSN